jgi:hypothetical protein
MAHPLPNIFVIGAPKSGTSALVSAIGQHPEIYVPSKKEPRYFDAHTFYDYREDYPLKNIEDYLSLFKSIDAINASYRVDGSVFNMYSPESIKNILKMSPSAKFILILRDPVNASKSMHAQRLKYSTARMREISEDFCTCWKSLEMRKAGKMYPKSCRNKFLFIYVLLYKYELYIPKILDMVSSENIYIARHERLKSDPDSIYKDIFLFLNVKYDYLPETKIINPSYIGKTTLLSKLASHFAHRSSGFRGALGLCGKRMDIFKKIFFIKQEVTHYADQNCDDEVRAFFQSTYNFLNKL